MTLFNPQIRNTENNKPQIDVSQRALAIARELDRRPAGTYLIMVEKVDDRAVQWETVFYGAIVVKELKAFEAKEKPASIDTKPP